MRLTENDFKLVQKNGKSHFKPYEERIVKNVIKINGILSVSHIAMFLPERTIEEVKLYLIESGLSFPSYQRCWSIQNDELLKELFHKYGGNLT
jgi:hypothetical protein